MSNAVTDPVVELDITTHIVPSAPIYDLEFDKQIAALSKWCNATNQEVHTKLKGGSFIVVKRKQKVSSNVNS